LSACKFRPKRFHQIDHREQRQQLPQQQEGYFIGAEVLLEGSGLDYPEEPPPAYSELFPQNEAAPGEASNRDQETSEMLAAAADDDDADADNVVDDASGGLGEAAAVERLSHRRSLS
jgi:hypothetical protein